MAINNPYVGAGITTIMGQEGNPMGGYVESRSANMSNPDETPEEAIIRLHQANAGIDQIAQLTGVPSAQVAQVLNNYTAADTRPFTTEDYNPRPLETGVGEEIGVGEETGVDQKLMSERLGTKTLMQLDSTIMDPREAEGYEQEITKTMQDVFGVGVADPRDDQLINALSVAGVEELSDDNNPEGGEATKDLVLERMGLNEVFTNADMGLEERIDFFKQYIASTLNLDSETLKKTPSEGTPYLAMASALLNASKDGQSRMSGFGQAMVAYGLTKRQMQQVGNKEAGAYLLKSFDLGLEAQKIATAGSKDGLGNIGQYIVPTVSNEPILMGDLEALTYQRQGLKLKKYSETSENPKRYAIPKYNADRSGVVYEHRTMTPTAAKNTIIDGDLTAAGYSVNEVDATNARTFGFIKSPDGEIEQISMQEYLTLPTNDPRKGYEFMKAGDTQAVFDLEEGIARIVSKSEVLKNPLTTLEDGTEVNRYVPNTMMKTTTISPEGIVTIMEGPAGSAGDYADSRAAKSELRETREKLINLDVGTRKVLDSVDLVSEIATKGLFGAPAQVMTTLGNLYSSAKDVYDAYREERIVDGTAIKGNSYENLYANFQEKYNAELDGWEWVKKARGLGIEKDRITAGMFGLAISSAKLLAEQKGRDISNADIERFMQEIGANASSLYGFESIILDLEKKVLQNYLRQAGPDGIYRDTQVLINDPTDASKPQVGNLSVGNQYFAPGARGEKTLKFIEDRMKALEERRGSLSTASGGAVSSAAPADSYTSFKRKVENDQSGVGKNITRFESTGNTITWGKLAKQIVFDETVNDPSTAEQLTKQRINDAFPDTPAGAEAMDEFMAWYTTL
jgi:hypothetical protein